MNGGGFSTATGSAGGAGCGTDATTSGNPSWTGPETPTPNAYAAAGASRPSSSRTSWPSSTIAASSLVAQERGEPVGRLDPIAELLLANLELGDARLDLPLQLAPALLQPRDTGLFAVGGVHQMTTSSQ